MLLQSFDKFDIVAQVENTVDIPIIFSKSKCNFNAIIPVCGKFSYVEGVFAALYVQHNVFYFQFNHSVWELDNSIKADLVETRNRRVFSLKNEIETIVNLPHTKPIFDFIFNDSTSVEEEDFDFLMWVYHVISFVERRNILLDVYQGC